MESEAAGQLARQVKGVALMGGAAVVGLADLRALLRAPASPPLFALVFGVRYPDTAIERLPSEDELAVALDDLVPVTSRIYAAVEAILRGADRAVRCCRHDAVERTFGPLRAVPSQKAVAVLAGPGWIGKSSLLVTPGHGPRVRLGTLYTDALLLPDVPFAANHCGDCHACREACPAGAVTEEPLSRGQFQGYRIDVAQCRAHLSRDEARVGRRAFCGLCLKVCPFGR